MEQTVYTELVRIRELLAVLVGGQQQLILWLVLAIIVSNLGAKGLELLIKYFNGRNV